VKTKTRISFALASTAAVLGLLLSSCSSVDTIDSVATVNGTKIGRDEFESLANLLDEAKIFTMTNGALSADDARQVLNTMINAALVRDVLEEFDTTVTDPDRDTVRSNLAESGQLDSYPAVLQDYVIGLYADQTALSRVEALSSDEVQKLYESAPGAAGVMCLRHLVVEEETTAEEALAEVESGADFADVAGEYSTEPNAAESGGALRDTNNDNDCIPLSQYQSQFDLDFVRGALTAMPGEVVGPIKSSFGWHLIQARSYDDIESSLQAIFANNTGSSLADAAILGADVRVDSSFGKWDAQSGTVIDL
jgi:parvulin-like peptidyl-prolyl isomerase